MEKAIYCSKENRFRREKYYDYRAEHPQMGYPLDAVVQNKNEALSRLHYAGYLWVTKEMIRRY